MITITKLQKAPEKRYSIQTVAQAIGRSENSIYSYFTNQTPPVSVKGGLTIEQIAEVAMSRRRGEIIKWEDIPEIRNRLAKEHAILITWEETPEQLRTETD